MARVFFGLLILLKIILYSKHVSRVKETTYRPCACWVHAIIIQELLQPCGYRSAHLREMS